MSETPNEAGRTPPILPRPDFHFTGEVGRTFKDSDPPQFPQPVQAPKGAPNVVLILLDDETGRLAETTNLDTLLGGALLTELALAGTVEVGEKEGLLRRRKVRAAEPTPPLSDPALRRALATVMEKDRTAEELVPRLGKKVRDDLLGRLSDRGLVRREESKVLGVFSRTRWPAVDDAHERELRRLLRSALVGGADPDDRTAALIALLHAVDRAHKSVELDGVRSREVKKRAKEIAQGEWAAAAVRDAVQASQAAVMAAVMVATTAGATAGGS